VVRTAAGPRRSGVPTAVGTPPLRPPSLSEFAADLWQDLGAEQLDAFEEDAVGHTADVHLQDLTAVPE